MKLYLIDVIPKKKEMIIVRSNRRLFNLVPFNPKAFLVLTELFPDYKINEVDEKHFKAVGEQGMENSKKT